MAAGLAVEVGGAEQADGSRHVAHGAVLGEQGLPQRHRLAVLVGLQAVEDRAGLDGHDVERHRRVALLEQIHREGLGPDEGVVVDDQRVGRADHRSDPVDAQPLAPVEPVLEHPHAEGSSDDRGVIDRLVGDDEDVLRQDMAEQLLDGGADDLGAVVAGDDHRHVGRSDPCSLGGRDAAHWRTRGAGRRCRGGTRCPPRGTTPARGHRAPRGSR